MTLADQLLAEARRLPEHLVREALDFVLFLRQRHEREAERDLMNAQSKSLTEIWDNDEDEVWNRV